MPSEEGGGSRTIFNPPPKEEEVSAAASAKGKKGAKKSATGKKKSADGKKSAKGKGDKKKKKGEEEEEDPGPQKSIFQPMLEKASEQYGGVMSSCFCCSHTVLNQCCVVIVFLSIPTLASGLEAQCSGQDECPPEARP